MPTFVSLVIPVYNREAYLAATLDSILAQTYPHFELLLWDDQSTDRSLEIAQHYATQDARIRVVAAPHQGFTASLRAAFPLTLGTYIAWVDSDDRLAPTALAETVALLDQQPHTGLVYTDHTLMDAQGQPLGLGQRCNIEYDRDRLLVDFMAFHFRLIRRSVFEQIGGIDPASGLVPDYDLCLRLSEVSQIQHLRRPLYFYRVHGQSMSQQQQQQTIQDSQAAVERALERRGLAQHYQLVVELEPEVNQVRSRFSIQAKAAC
jgi:glycosyltransferase involved in cell wall biosynthesis